MKTHFARRRLGFHDRLQSNLEGVVYNAVPPDRLVTHQELHDLVRSQLLAHPEDGTYRHREVDAVIGVLAARKVLVELAGVRIERMIDGF